MIFRHSFLIFWKAIIFEQLDGIQKPFLKIFVQQFNFE